MAQAGPEWPLSCVCPIRDTRTKRAETSNSLLMMSYGNREAGFVLLCGFVGFRDGLRARQERWEQQSGISRCRKDGVEDYVALTCSVMTRRECCNSLKQRRLLAFSYRQAQTTNNRDLGKAVIDVDLIQLVDKRYIMHTFLIST